MFKVYWLTSSWFFLYFSKRSIVVLIFFSFNDLIFFLLFKMILFWGKRPSTRESERESETMLDEMSSFVLHSIRTVLFFLSRFRCVCLHFSQSLTTFLSLFSSNSVNILFSREIERRLENLGEYFLSIRPKKRSTRLEETGEDITVA